MSYSSHIRRAAAVLLVACLISSALILHHLDRIRTHATLEEILFITSPKALKHLSLGYEGLLADIYWTRAVQYFGGKHYEGAQKYELLAPLLDIATALDPQLTVAYEFGANFLAPPPPNGAGMPQKAVHLAEYGVRHNPNDWHLYYDLGFIYYMDLHDPAKAADAFARGSKIPGAHPWLKLLAAQMAEHAGEIQTAQLMWTTTYQTTNDPNVRANAAAHLRALRVDQDVTALEDLVSQYKIRTGHSPETFSDLASAGIIRGIPVDPLGKPYKLTSDGQVELSDPDNFPFVRKGLPPGYKPPAAPKFLPAD